MISRELTARLCQSIAEPSLIVSAAGEVMCANAAAASMLGFPAAELVERRLQDLSADPAHTSAILARFTRVQSPLPGSLRLLVKGGTLECRCNGNVISPGESADDRYLFLRLTPKDPANESFLALNQKIQELDREVAARRRSESLLASQQAVLEMMLHDAPLAEVLARLCTAVEQQSERRALASILLLEGSRLRHGAAPSLPAEYNAAMDGLEIGPGNGCCGAAAHHGSPIIVEDIETDPLWEGFRGPAARAGLRACWSTPVMSKQGTVLGTFTLYYRQPQKPSRADWQMVGIVTRMAAIAIERSRMDAERRSREAALQRKDEQLSAALAASRTGTYRWEPRTDHLVYFDEHLMELFGFEPGEQVTRAEEFIGRIHRDDRRAVRHAMRGCAGGADLDIEYRVVLPDGSIRWHYDRGKFVATGGEPCVVGACTDITARKQAEEALRESEQQFRTMADAIPQLAWMTDADGYIHWYNQRWYEYTGTTPEEMRGWGWQAVHDPAELPRVLEKWTTALRAGTPWEDSFPLRGKDGKYRVFLSRAFPLRDSQGKVVRWLGTNTDISDHIQAQEILRRTEKLAAAGRLAASIAHEINNPLEAVTNLLFLGATDEAVPAHVKQYLKVADEELQRVVHIARQTLGFYRETMHPSRFLVTEELENVVRFHSRKMAEKQISVQQRHRSPGEMVAPRGEVRQVLANLIGNALEAMSGPGKLVLRVSATRNGAGREALRITVADQGCGIAREHLANIFEPFFTTKKDTGTGLGLWVTKEIVEKLQGRIRVRSRATPGKSGTVFMVLLPTATGAQQPLGQTNAA